MNDSDDTLCGNEPGGANEPGTPLQTIPPECRHCHGRGVVQVDPTNSATIFETLICGSCGGSGVGPNAFKDDFWGVKGFSING